MHEFQSQDVTIVVASHSMGLVEEFCQRVRLIDGGHLVEEGLPQAVIPRYLEMVGHLPEMAI
ncbi:MAG: hypothetical protein V3S20_08415 [Dehalococcoidia bacterium]